MGYFLFKHNNTLFIYPDKYLHREREAHCTADKGRERLATRPTAHSQGSVRERRRGREQRSDVKEVREEDGEEGGERWRWS